MVEHDLINFNNHFKSFIFKDNKDEAIAYANNRRQHTVLNYATMGRFESGRDFTVPVENIELDDSVSENEDNNGNNDETNAELAEPEQIVSHRSFYIFLSTPISLQQPPMTPKAFTTFGCFSSFFAD